MTQNTQPLKGFRDFLPSDASARMWLRSQMIKVFSKWGYEPLETPTLEPAALFTGQVGEDEKLFYKFIDFGGREVILRYDQTVPTCRILGQYFGQLTFPFRRYQIQSAFRGENPQAGRFREFTQADLDIFGVASPTADAEIIAATLDLYRSLGFKEVVALINSRSLMTNIPYAAIVAIDKLPKIGEAAVIKDMEAKGILAAQAEIYLNFVKNLQPNTEINTIFSYLKSAGFPQESYRFEPTLARSFAYSEGPIWEIKIPGYAPGSVAGGERYDAMVEKISGQKIPGTGIGIGFDRTLDACRQFGLVPGYVSPTKVLVTVFSPDLFSLSLEIANSLRLEDVATEVYPEPETKLDKQLKYASKKAIPFVVIIGPEEAAAKTAVLKDLNLKTQITIPQSEIAKQLS